MQEPLPLTVENPGRLRSSLAARRREDADWRIDARTRRVGLAGVARARAVLEATKAAQRSTEPDAA